MGPAWRGGRRAARQLERPAVLHAITVIDHEHRERHGKGGAGGISDSEVIANMHPLALPFSSPFFVHTISLPPAFASA